MDYRQLGRSGLRVSALTLGTMTFGGRGAMADVGSTDVAGARRQLDMCLDAGVNLVDTANVYSAGVSEEILGEALEGRRDRLLLATKARMPMGDGPNDAGLSRHHLIASCEASLRRLNVDHVDLFQVHEWDGHTPLEETLHALDTLVRDGKVRHIACSNFSAAQIRAAQAAAHAKDLAPFVATQDQYNLLSREIEAELVPAIEAEKLALLPYFPLASGMLTGKYRLGQPIPEGTRLSNARYSDRFVNDENLRIVERLEEFCAARGRTLLQLAFAWLLAKPFVASVIAGASTPEQLRQNTGAIGWQLGAEEIAEVATLTSRG
jgi:aryl-alcohol dehydrogenase-like predicted oxidoreductase